MFAAQIRRKRVERMRAITHWRWPFDEAYVKITGETHSLLRTVNHEGEVLESTLADQTEDPRSSGFRAIRCWNRDARTSPFAAAAGAV